jgi:predicted MFS family arabinose efflux permease
MIVPPLASWLFEVGGWRFAFMGTALAGLLWVPAWILVTRDPAVRARLDEHAQARARAPVARIPFRELARDRNMVRAWLAVLAAAPIAGFGLTWAAKFLHREFEVRQEDVGRYLWLAPLLFDVGALGFGDLASRRPAWRRSLFVVAMLLGTAIIGLRFVDGPWQTVAVLGVAMAGGGAIYTLVTADLMSRIAPSSISLAGGTVAAAQSLILIIANPLIGRSVDHFGSYDVAVTATAVWAVPGCLAWLLLRPRVAQL